MAMSPSTQEIYDDIIRWTNEHPEDTIIVATFAWAYKNRAGANAAFRAAHKAGVIEPGCRSCAGNIIWKKVAA